MSAFIIRRIIQAVFTVFGVMLLTFLLFRAIPGDVSARFVGEKADAQQRQDWLERHGLNRPELISPDYPYQFWKADFWDTQFFNHFRDTVTFQGTSYATEQKLTEIIAGRARYSLAITVPAMAIGWFLAMIISCLVAYYRGTWVDRAGVLVTVLGMCVPFLAYMILGQWLAFQIDPELALGLSRPTNIYLPIAIAVIAGLGASVRFYRTIILDEINRDYVRTARAKGAALPSVLSGMS